MDILVAIADLFGVLVIVCATGVLGLALIVVAVILWAGGQ